MHSKHPRFASIKGIVTHILPDDEPSSVNGEVHPDLRAAIREEVQRYLEEREHNSEEPLDFSGIPGHIMHVAPRKKGEQQ